MRELNGAVIGLGVGAAHAAAIAQHPGCTLSAVCDLDPALAAKVAAATPGCRAADDAESILDDDSIDVVVVASYDDVHAAQIIRALERGKHVFAEKPLCLTAAELAAIESAWKSAGDRRLSGNLILRASPRFQWIRGAVSDGTLGQLYHVQAEYHYGRLHKLSDGWRGRIPTYSVMLGGGIHMIDLLLWLTGQRVRAVSAAGTSISGTAAGSSFAGDDCTVALLEFDNGMIGTVAANFGCVRPHFHGLRLDGTAGTLENRAAGPQLWTSRDADVTPQVVEVPGAKPDKGELLKTFIETLHGRSETPVTEAELFHAMAVGCAIDEAVHSGARVVLASKRGQTPFL